MKLPEPNEHESHTLAQQTPHPSLQSVSSGKLFIVPSWIWGRNCLYSSKLSCLHVFMMVFRDFRKFYFGRILFSQGGIMFVTHFQYFCALTGVLFAGFAMGLFLGRDCTK